MAPSRSWRLRLTATATACLVWAISLADASISLSDASMSLAGASATYGGPSLGSLSLTGTPSTTGGTTGLGSRSMHSRERGASARSLVQLRVVKVVRTTDSNVTSATGTGTTTGNSTGTSGRSNGTTDGTGSGSGSTGSIGGSSNGTSGSIGGLSGKGKSPSGCTFLVGGPKGLKRVQEAVDKIGRNSASQRKVICVMPGVYKENVLIRPGQDGITIRGSGMNRTRIVAGKSKKSNKVDPFSPATLMVKGSFFRGENFTVENSSKNLTTPSPAVSLLGNSSTWEKVGIEAWDDTLGIQTSRHIFKDCLVTGLVDMIWGFGRAAFQNTDIYIRFYYNPKVVYTGHICTMGTDYTSFGTTAGATFYGCSVYGPGLAALGQAYRPKVMVTYVNCKLGSNVVKHGWNNLFNRYSSGQSIFREYGSSGPGASLTKRKLGKAYKGPAPASLQLRSYIGAELADQAQRLSKVFGTSTPFYD